MRHRLGRFVAKPGSNAFSFMRHTAEGTALLERALEEMLQMPLAGDPARPRDGERVSTPLDPPSSMGLLGDLVGDEFVDDPMEAPDLLEALEPGDPDRAWVSSVSTVLEQLDRRNTVRLLACERRPGDEGFTAIAATALRPRGNVRPRDGVQAGFVAVRRGDGAVRVSPRAFRLVCSNGSIVSTFEGENAAIEAGAVSAAIERCFDPQHFEVILEHLRIAARTRVPHPRPMVDEGGMLLHLGLERRYQALFESFMRVAHARARAELESLGADYTYYDEMNVWTEAAKVLDYPERFDVEEAAGRIAWLRQLPRSRPGSARRPIPILETV